MVAVGEEGTGQAHISGADIEQQEVAAAAFVVVVAAVVVAVVWACCASRCSWRAVAVSA